MALFGESDFFQEWDPIRKSRPIRKYFVRISNKAYAFFHFCTLSFARDTPILLRDTDFDVFFRVTARWVK